MQQQMFGTSRYGHNLILKGGWRLKIQIQILRILNLINPKLAIGIQLSIEI